MTSSTANIEAQIRKLQEQKAQMEEQAKQSKECNAEKFRIACYKGDKAVVMELLSTVDFNSGDIAYNRKKAQQEEMQYEWMKDGKSNDAINNAIRGDHPDILWLLIGRAIELLRDEIRHYNKKKRNEYRYSSREFNDYYGEDVHSIKQILLNIINTTDSQPVPYHYNLDRDNESKTGFMSRHQPLLIEAILLDSPKCAELLLNEFGADPNSPFYEHHSGLMTGYYYNEQGNALALAIDHGLTDLALLLIKKGANLTALYGNQEKSVDTGYAGRSNYVMRWDGNRDLTPLLLAAQKNNRIVVQALLDCGADTRPTYHGKTAWNLTTDAEIKKLLEMPNTNKGRLAKLAQHDPINSLFICTISHEIMEDPISWHGIIFCREAFRKLNNRNEDNKKVDPYGKPISKEEHDAILDPSKTFTLQPIKQAICSFVNDQEEKARAAKSANRMLK